MHRGSLIAFWLRESPNYVFGILDRQISPSNGTYVFSENWRAVTMPGLAPLRDTLTSNSIAIQNEGKVVIFGGFRGQETVETKYLSEFMTVDLDKKIWSIKKKGLKRGDMFYYNQRSCSRIGRPTIAVLGKEHVHFIDTNDFASTGIHEDDGDFPLC